MKKKMKLYNFKRGQMLVMALIFLAIVMILAASLFARTAGFLRFGSRSISQEQAINLAEAGIERTLWKLNTTAGACPDCAQEYTVGTTGTFKVTIADKTASLKTITATGYIPDSSNPNSKTTIKADLYIASEQISFRYAVQVGTGGVAMSNLATINGNVYSNASDAQTAPNKSIQGSGSSKINGDAWTVGTISTPDPQVVGTKNENQQTSQMPSIDYQNWKDQATAGGTIDCSADPSLCNLSGSGSTNIGPKKYIGNLTLSNTHVATMQGPIYVTGNVSVSNTAKIKLDQSFGSSGTVMIVDGTVHVSNSGAFESTSANPKGYILVATTSTDLGAVTISNQGVNAIFYALEGGAQLANSAHVTALVAKSLAMQNSAVLDYDQGLASAQFSGGPGGSWQIKKGTYKFTSSP